MTGYPLGAMTGYPLGAMTGSPLGAMKRLRRLLPTTLLLVCLAPACSEGEARLGGRDRIPASKEARIPASKEARVPASKEGSTAGAAVLSSSPTGASPSGALRFRDGLGRWLHLKRRPARIAALSPSHVEGLFALGCGGRVVLRDRRADYPRAALALPAANGLNPAPEHIAGFRPELVLLSHGDANRLRGFESLGVRVAVFEPRTVAGVRANLELLAHICNAAPAALTRTLDAFDRRLEAARRYHTGARPRTYVELDGSDGAKPWTAGGSSLIGDVVRLAGGQNIFARLSRPYAQISAEEVLRAAPALIVVAHRGASPLRRPAWGALLARARTRIVSSIDPNLLSRPGPRIAEGVLQLARALHGGSWMRGNEVDRRRPEAAGAGRGPRAQGREPKTMDD